ncbi:MAG: beta-ketoacyl synthase chain length factor [Desulfobulbaceae bacterium]|nr:beta-ketoacyl synthase chain length factor [Desulfobulbaceae bacterium]
MSDGVFIQSIEIVDGANLDSVVPQHLLRDLRRADDFIKLAVVAADALISSLPTESSLPEDTGIFLGTTTGSLDTNFRFLDTLLDDGEGQSSPTLFSHSVHNSAAGYVARLFNIRGPALTVTTSSWPFLSALAEAQVAIATGQLQVALVLGVEEDTPLIDEARSRAMAGDEQLAEPPACRKGAVGWLLVADSVTGKNRNPGLGTIVLKERLVDPVDYLIRTETISSSTEDGSAIGWCPDALKVPVSLSKAVPSASGMNMPCLEWSVVASFGEARVVVELDNDGEVTP